LNSKRIYAIAKERNPGAVVFVKVPSGWYTFDRDIDALIKAYPSAVVAANFAHIKGSERPEVVTALRKAGKRCIWADGEQRPRRWVDRLAHG
jgi:hypothetical protein